jgi:hypothetical protein
MRLALNDLDSVELVVKKLCVWHGQVRVYHEWTHSPGGSGYIHTSQRAGEIATCGIVAWHRCGRTYWPCSRDVGAVSACFRGLVAGQPHPDVWFQHDPER